MGGKPKAATAAEPVTRDPTPAEVAAIAAAHERQAKRPARPSVTYTADEGAVGKISNPHKDWKGWITHTREAFGTSSEPFMHLAYSQAINALSGRQKRPTETEANAVLALMGAIEPRDELEAAIAVQIIAAHAASLDFMQRARLNAGEYVGSAATYATMATKASRTMAAHIESLAKLRSGGKQTHEVRYIYVNGPAAFGPGAKAAAAYGGGGGDTENPSQSQAPQLRYQPGERCPPMWGADAAGHALQGAEGEGAEAVPNAWGESGSAAGEG